MDLTIPASTQGYLAALNNTQSQMAKAQAQISSGSRLQNVADDPAAVASVYRYQAGIASTQATQSNLSAANDEVSSADAALQTAIQSLDSAISLGAQGANSTRTAQDRANFAQQLSGILETLVSVSQTQVNGRYIFSGDQDTQPAYQLDSTQPNGVKQLVSGASTRTILDSSGVPITVAHTAQQIFDSRDTNGQPDANNVFAAVGSLVTALQNNDTAGITNAVASLHTASDHVNQQLAFYGETQDRLTTAADLAQKFLTFQKGSLSKVQDADVASAALTLTQATTQQQAELSVEAKLQQQPNLFSLLA